MTSQDPVEVLLQFLMHFIQSVAYRARALNNKATIILDFDSKLYKATSTATYPYKCKS